MGDGLAIIPNEGKIFSPITGKVKTVSRDKHIIIIESNDGLEVLIHIGIGTLGIDSGLIDCLVKPGHDVKIGDLIINFDLEGIKNKVKSIVTPVIFTTLDDNEYIYYRFNSILSKIKKYNIFICKK